jgi:hypothetical protein
VSGSLVGMVSEHEAGTVVDTRLRQAVGYHVDAPEGHLGIVQGVPQVGESRLNGSRRHGDDRFRRLRRPRRYWHRRWVLITQGKREPGMDDGRRRDTDQT